MDFPPIISELLNCPGLLRLRDVRMANNQFVAFPAFASTTRYEHSLGVCYLASICAKSIGLSEKDTIELMIACLYHDVGTPPFAHAMEEVLQAKFGFDHEQNLKNLIMGTTDDFDGDLAQIFLGEGLKLKSICQSKKGRLLGLDVHRIAKIATGDKEEYLSPLISGNGMDLDNIDNIIRASTAMGLLHSEEECLAITLAKSFVLENGQIFYNGLQLSEIHRWQEIRDIQYSAIYESIEDFSYQTMIKKAIQLLLEDDDNTKKIEKNAWRLTDSSITHEYLLRHKKSRDIMIRVLLCKPYYCLGILYIQGNFVSRYINSHLAEIELLTSEYFAKIMGISEKKLNSINTNAVVANFFPDKRKRQIKSKAILWNQEIEIDSSLEMPQGALLGFFTPFINSNYKTVDVNIKKRKIVSFSKSNIEELIRLLSETCLKGFDIKIFGGESNGQTNSNTDEYQLGLF